MYFRDAIERRLAQLRYLLRQILAAENLLLAQFRVDIGDTLAGAGEINDELLEEAAGKESSHL